MDDGRKVMVCGVQCHFQQYFSYIKASSFIGGGNRSTGRKPLTSCVHVVGIVWKLDLQLPMQKCISPLKL
jgi:hypothetical protein